MSVSGIGNKVTAERYRTIKKYVEDRDLSCKDDVTVGKIFGVGVTTVRMVRNTRDYEEYLAKSKSYHKKASNGSRGRKVVMPSSGLPLEKIPTNKYGIDSSAAMLGGVGAAILLFMIVLAAVVIWLVFREFYGI